MDIIEQTIKELTETKYTCKDGCIGYLTDEELAKHGTEQHAIVLCAQHKNRMQRG